jgi:hypothetical protein
MAKRICQLSVFVAVAFLLPALAFARAAEGATTPETVAQGVGTLVDAVRLGSWVGIAGALIMLVLNLMRLPLLGGLMNKIPKRWRIALPIILGGVAGILSNIAGGAPALEALMVGLFTGPTAVFGHEAVYKAILGKTGSSDP